MGEHVWASITIGGEIAIDAMPSLISAGEAEFQGAEKAVAEAFRTGRALMLEGQRNYGNAPATEEFCRENGLAYVLAWDGAAGAFSAGSRYWRPGMYAPEDGLCDMDGLPCINVANLRLHETAGRSIADVVHELELFDSAAVPPLVMVPTPTETTSPPTDAMSGALDALVQAAPELLAFARAVLAGASIDGRWLDAQGNALDGFDSEDDVPGEDEWPGATWEPFTVEEQTDFLAGLAEHARQLIAKAEGRANG